MRGEKNREEKVRQKKENDGEGKMKAGGESEGKKG